MKALLQRVTKASVTVGGQVVGSIGRGLVILVGVATGDTERDADLMADKAIKLRIFPDENDKLNLSALDIGGELLIISQFTLVADTKKGRRPSFTGAAPLGLAQALFNHFVRAARASGLGVETGRFQQYMHVEIHNEGPVTIMLDSRD